MGCALEGIQRKPTSPRRRDPRLWQRALREKLVLYRENPSCRLTDHKKMPSRKKETESSDSVYPRRDEYKRVRTAMDGGPGIEAGTRPPKCGFLTRQFVALSIPFKWSGSGGVRKTKGEFDVSNSTGNTGPDEAALWRASASFSLSIMPHYRKLKRSVRRNVQLFKLSCIREDKLFSGQMRTPGTASFARVVAFEFSLSECFFLFSS